jgi:hypothetical protein
MARDLLLEFAYKVFRSVCPPNVGTCGSNVPAKSGGQHLAGRCKTVISAEIRLLGRRFEWFRVVGGLFRMGLLSGTGARIEVRSGSGSGQRGQFSQSGQVERSSGQF